MSGLTSSPHSQQLECFEVIKSMYGVLEGELLVHSNKNSNSEVIDFTVFLPFQEQNRLPLHCLLFMEDHPSLVSITVETFRAPWLVRSVAAFISSELKKKLAEDCASYQNSTEILLSVFDWAQNKLQELVKDFTEKQLTTEKNNQVVLSSADCMFVRTWIYLPMLYTKEKRADLIAYGKIYDITGFVAAGKPACMCLEGTAENVSQYLSDIRSISWADIPPQDKKMSTMAQDKVQCESQAQLQAQRKFGPIEELTFEVHGKMSNHQDLAQLENWLSDRGFSAAFQVLFPKLSKC